jgi:hypothetical protein
MPTHIKHTAKLLTRFEQESVGRNLADAAQHELHKHPERYASVQSASTDHLEPLTPR